MTSLDRYKSTRETTLSPPIKSRAVRKVRRITLTAFIAILPSLTEGGGSTMCLRGQTQGESYSPAEYSLDPELARIFSSLEERYRPFYMGLMKYVLGRDECSEDENEQLESLWDEIAGKEPFSPLEQEKLLTLFHDDETCLGSIQRDPGVLVGQPSLDKK